MSRDSRSSYNGSKHKFNPLNLNPTTIFDKPQPILSRASAGASLSNFKPLPPIPTGNEATWIYSGMISQETSGGNELTKETEYEGVNSVPPSALPNSRSYRRPSKTRPSTTTKSVISIADSAKIVVVSRAATPVIKEDAQEVKPKTDTKRVYFRSDFAHALEPKVQIPSDSNTGKTPRKVEVERRKRLYSGQKIGELIVREAEAVSADIADTWRNSESYRLTGKSLFVQGENGHPSRIKILDDFPFEDFAELKYFDNTEFESRDLQDWLNIRSDHDASPHIPIIKDGVQYAKIPIPGKAFNAVENKWADCLVYAYDHTNNLWKIQWRVQDGWGLEKMQSSSSDGLFEDDKDAIVSIEKPKTDELKFENASHDMGERSIGNDEAWLHR